MALAVGVQPYLSGNVMTCHNYGFVITAFEALDERATGADVRAVACLCCPIMQTALIGVRA